MLFSQCVTCLKHPFEDWVILLMWPSCSYCTLLSALILVTYHLSSSPRGMIRLDMGGSTDNPLIWFLCNLSCPPFFPYGFWTHFIYSMQWYCLLACIPFFIWMADKSLLKLFSLSSSVWEEKQQQWRDCGICSSCVCMLVKFSASTSPFSIPAVLLHHCDPLSVPLMSSLSPRSMM